MKIAKPGVSSMPSILLADMHMVGDMNADMLIYGGDFVQQCLLWLCKGMTHSLATTRTGIVVHMCCIYKEISCQS